MQRYWFLNAVFLVFCNFTPQWPPAYCPRSLCTSMEGLPHMAITFANLHSIAPRNIFQFMRTNSRSSVFVWISKFNRLDERRSSAASAAAISAWWRTEIVLLTIIHLIDLSSLQILFSPCSINSILECVIPLPRSQQKFPALPKSEDCTFRVK